MYQLYLWQFLLIVLAFIEHFYRYDVIVWPHNREKVLCKIALLPIGQYCLPCSVIWLVVVLKDFGLCRSYDLIQVPLQFSTGMSSSGGINCINQDYSLILLFNFSFLGSGCPNFCKKGSTRGVNYPKFGVLRVVPFMGSSPGTRIILVKNADCLLFILFGSPWICYFNPVCSGH